MDGPLWKLVFYKSSSVTLFIVCETKVLNLAISQYENLVFNFHDSAANKCLRLCRLSRYVFSLQGGRKKMDPLTNSSLLNHSAIKKQSTYVVCWKYLENGLKVVHWSVGSLFLLIWICMFWEMILYCNVFFVVLFNFSLISERNTYKLYINKFVIS